VTAVATKAAAARDLKLYDDTTDVSDGFRMWGALCDEKHAFASPDGDFVKCSLCVGFGKSKGVIKSCRNFDIGHWEDHCDSKCHQDALSHYQAAKNSKHPQAQKMQGKSNMLKYFSVLPKKRMLWKLALTLLHHLLLPLLLP